MRTLHYYISEGTTRAQSVILLLCLYSSTLLLCYSVFKTVILSEVDDGIPAPRRVDGEGDAEAGLTDVVLYHGIDGSMYRIGVHRHVVGHLQTEAAQAVGGEHLGIPATGFSIIGLQLGIAVAIGIQLLLAREEREREQTDAK